MKIKKIETTVNSGNRLLKKLEVNRLNKTSLKLGVFSVLFTASERQDRERLRQENEIEELRSALKRSAGVVQLDETRRELEKSERQRQQLSDHIEV